MPTTHPLIVRTAERPGSENSPTEDRIFQTSTAVVILDGATQAFALERSGAWIADQVGSRLAAGLEEESSIDLRSLLKRTIAEVVDEFDLRPGSSPSTTVSIVRVNHEVIDILVLCDSPVIVMNKRGQVTEVQDDRLATVSSSIFRPHGKRDMSKSEWVERMATFEAYRNKPGGYWCVSASPEAADEAITKQIPLSDCEAILLMTDGVSAGIDTYKTLSWSEAFGVAQQDPHKLVDLVHETEVSDPAAERWPRGKIHDDKALALLAFSHTAG